MRSSWGGGIFVLPSWFVVLSPSSFYCARGQVVPPWASLAHECLSVPLCWARWTAEHETAAVFWGNQWQVWPSKNSLCRTKLGSSEMESSLRCSWCVKTPCPGRRNHERSCDWLPEEHFISRDLVFCAGETQLEVLQGEQLCAAMSPNNQAKGSQVLSFPGWDHTTERCQTLSKPAPAVYVLYPLLILTCSFHPN